MSDQNQLMEAAAEVLNRSRADASSQPMQKADASSVGGTQDLGGPTPENYKQDIHSIVIPVSIISLTIPEGHLLDGNSFFQGDLSAFSCFFVGGKVKQEGAKSLPFILSFCFTYNSSNLFKNEIRSKVNKKNKISPKCQKNMPWNLFFCGF